MKRVIMLDRVGRDQYRVALWAAVPAGREQVYADVNKTSAYDSASAAELTALRAGQVAEDVEIVRFRPNATQAEIRAELQAQAAKWQAEVDQENPRDRYGTNWDGTAWTNDGAP